ncbi:MAG: hypothetical protein LC795_11835 [Acidobacteria bacterium]|nr:hypothetical protein [Acidobacteriota bacterium]
MTKRASLFPGAVAAVALLFCAGASAQTGERRPAGAATQTQEQPSAAAPLADPVANEISLLRRSLQTLNTRLREISEKLLGPDAPKPGESQDERQKRITQNLDLLSRTEQRAEAMRKQLIELTEKETAFKTRIMQLDEDMRPDSIDRSVMMVGSIGSTRTTEMRDTRRRVLDNERRGVESLLNQTSASRARLEEDVRQADALVARLRMRLLPLIEKEIDKINPAQEERPRESRGGGATGAR